MKAYEQRLLARIQATGSKLCVGLDPRPERIEGSVGDFLKEVVAQTAEHVAAYKPNIAYFESMGLEGLRLLEDILTKVIPEDIPVILDVKRSDIPETQKYYAKAYFENWPVDAVTVNAYMGFDSLEPYLKYEGKAIYALALTSNDGSQDLQTLKTEAGQVFDAVLSMAERAKDMPAAFGFVMGLTQLTPEALAKLPDQPLLLPGLGAQGGRLESLTARGFEAPILINSSRSILFGDEGSFGSRACATKERIADVLG